MFDDEELDGAGCLALAQRDIKVDLCCGVKLLKCIVLTSTFSWRKQEI